MIVINKKSAHNFKDYEQIYIGRGSIFGNPFRISENTSRKACIEKYKQYFRNRFKEDIKFKTAVLSLVENHHDKALVCFCKPLPCHGDFIKRVVEEITARRRG